MGCRLIPDMCNIRASGENLAGVRTEVYNEPQPALDGAGLVGSTPPQVYSPSHASQPLLKRAFCCLRFLTGRGEICPAVMHPSPTTLRAVEEKPKPHLSLESITGAGHHARWNDAELTHCVTGRLPKSATAPAGIWVKRSEPFNGFGVFLPFATTHHQA